MSPAVSTALPLLVMTLALRALSRSDQISGRLRAAFASDSETGRHACHRRAEFWRDRDFGFPG